MDPGYQHFQAWPLHKTGLHGQVFTDRLRTNGPSVEDCICSLRPALEFKIIYNDDRIFNLSELKSNMVKDGNRTIYFGLKLPKPDSGHWSIRIILHEKRNQNDQIQILGEKKLSFSNP